MLDTLKRRIARQGDSQSRFDSIAAKDLRHLLAHPLMESAWPRSSRRGLRALHAKVRDGARITVRALSRRIISVIKDLVIDRSALDRIVQAGGFISARAGRRRRRIDADSHARRDLAMEAAAASACGACAAACPNGSPCSSRRRKCHIIAAAAGKSRSAQGRFENGARDGAEGWHCTNTYECESGLSR